MANRNGYLTARDRRMLQFVARYRAATDDMFRRMFFSGVRNRTNVSRVMRRLVRQGLLRRVPIAPGRSYVVLTNKGCRTINVPAPSRRPLTEQSLPVVLAIAWYCVRTGAIRLTDKEFRQRYPELWKPGLRSSAYYLAETPQGRKLCMFLVDRGGTARRIKGKIRRLITQRASLATFVALIDAKRFGVTVLTGLPSQQQNLKRRLKRRFFHRVEIQVSLIPELGELLTLK